jgi:hypothetical protein
MVTRFYRDTYLLSEQTGTSGQAASDSTAILQHLVPGNTIDHSSTGITRPMVTISQSVLSPRSLSSLVTNLVTVSPVSILYSVHAMDV